MELNKIYQGDALEVLKTFPDKSINCCVTSPPYFGLRDYGVDGQIGLESTPEEYTSQIVEVFREVRRVLRDDGTLWLNLGDSYAAQRGGSHQPAKTLGGGIGGKTKTGGRVNRSRHDGYNPTRNASKIGLKHKDLIGIPWRIAFALQQDGWYLRSDIIWSKPNPMPESVTDRPTKAHEYIFLLSKSEKYYYDNESVKEPVSNSTIVRAKSKNNSYNRKDNGTAENQCGLTPEQQDKYYAKINETALRNKRSVWTITTRSFKGAHFATFPEDLIKPCILAGCPDGGTVLDPFFGSGTTGVVALKNNRNYIGIELNPEYCKIAEGRLNGTE